MPSFFVKFKIIKMDNNKIIKNKLKELFPNLKFSVRSKHYNSTYISLIQGNIDFEFDNEKKYKQVNHYHLKNEFSGIAFDVFNKILEICYKVFNVRIYETGDYGNQPSHYFHFEIGKWNKPYIFKQNSEELK